MSRPLVRALCREGGALLSNSNGGLRGGAVLIRKVPLVGLIAAAPRCSISCCRAAFPVPAIPPLRNNNTRPATTPRFPLTNSWNTTRHCSSHASSSLVKMATDRDILSDEYVSLPAFIPLSILELESLTTFFSTVSSRPTTTSLCSISSLTHPGHTKVALQSILQ